MSCTARTWHCGRRRTEQRRRLRSRPVGAVEDAFEAPTRAPQRIDDLPRPVEVFALACQRPLGRWTGREVAQIADLFRELHQFGGRRQARRVLDLKPLPGFFVQPLVVRHFGDYRGNRFSKGPCQLRTRGPGVLDRVVKQGRCDNPRICDTALVPQNVGEGERVIDVWSRFLVLAPLVAVFHGRELCRTQDEPRVICRSHFPMQNPAKIRPSRSSLVNSPVISLKACCAPRSSSAASSPARCSVSWRAASSVCSRARARASRCRRRALIAPPSTVWYPMHCFRCARRSCSPWPVRADNVM